MMPEDTQEQEIYRKADVVAEGQTFPHTDIHVGQDGVTIVTWLSPSRYDTQILTTDLMDELSRRWVMTHEPLRNELIAQSIQAKRSHLELIQSIKQSRND